jgi:hypothetical protein
MTERDLARIEKTLGVKLPDHYRRFLIDHGTALAKARKERGVPLFATAKEIIAANKELRKNPSLRDTNQDTEPWPLKYLIVGSDGGGDDWCVDLSSHDEVVWFFDSEAYGTFRHAEPATWAAYLAPQAASVVEPPSSRLYTCKKGVMGADAAGDRSFAVKDGKGRDWICFEIKELTDEELLAKVRGELLFPDWLSEKKLPRLTVSSIEELCAYLTKLR